MGEKGHSEQPVEETRPATADDERDERDLQQSDTDVKDADMDPEDHVNRPDQPDFDPAERRPYDDPTAGDFHLVRTRLRIDRSS